MKTLKWLLACTFVAMALARSAEARPQYKLVVDEKVKGQKIEPVVQELKCDFCHVPKENKKIRNTYGMALTKCGLNAERFNELRSDRNKLATFVQEVMKKAEAEKSPNGRTFGDLIKEGRAPGASLAQ